MACCAFALFLVGQALAFFAALRRRMPLRWLGDPDAGPRPNPATAWHLGQGPAQLGEAPAGPGRARRLLRPLVLAVCLEAALAVAGVGWITRHLTAETEAAPASLQLADSVWCGRSSWVE